jgi:PadR family transcriptional regulator PadR
VVVILSWKDDVEENLKCGLVEILILQLLSTEDMYGYQIKQEMYRRSNDSISIKEGSLYGPLYRMNEKKIISCYKKVVGNKRFRNYYHLEESGKEYLDYALLKFGEIFGGAQTLINWKGNNDEQTIKD